MYSIPTHPTGVVSRTLFLEDSKRATNPQKTLRKRKAVINCTSGYYMPERKNVKNVDYPLTGMTPKF